MHSPCHVSVKQAFLATHFASAGLSGRCCSPGTASYLADSQGLTGSLVDPEGLSVQLDPASIPSYSFHGAHMECTTKHRGVGREHERWLTPAEEPHDAPSNSF